MDTASQPGEIAISMQSVESELASADAVDVSARKSAEATLPTSLLEELWQAADAATCSLTRDEFASTLLAVATKHNFG